MNTRRCISALAALAIALLPPAIHAAIGSGTVLTGTIDRDLNSKNVQVGQTFLITGVHSSNHDINGATIYGHVANVQRAGMGTNAKVELAVDKINMRSGNIYQLTGVVSSAQVNTKANTGKEAAAAAGGALIGGLLGRGALGAILGGSGGFLIAKNSRENVDVPAGSIVQVQINSATIVRRQSSQ
jgi:hypothetical protein